MTPLSDMASWLETLDQVASPVGAAVGTAALVLALVAFVDGRRARQRRPGPVGVARGRRRLADGRRVTMGVTAAGLACLAAMLLLAKIVSGLPEDAAAVVAASPAPSPSPAASPPAPAGSLAANAPYVTYPRGNHVEVTETVEVVAPHGADEKAVVLVSHRGAQWYATECRDSRDGLKACPGVRFGQVEAHRGPWDLVVVVVTAARMAELAKRRYVHDGDPGDLEPIRQSRMYTYER